MRTISRSLLIRGLEMFLLLQVLDMLTTMIGIEGAGLMEGNSLPALTIQMAGWWGMAALKILAISVGLLNFLVAIWAPPNYRMPTIAVFLIINVMGIGVVMWNVVNILLALGLEIT